MTRKLPPLNAVRAFEAAARHVSFTKAAAELHVTHGAVSRQVAQLEAALGTPLFLRRASQLLLTEAGQGFLAECSAALDRLALAGQRVREAAAPRSLAVNAPPTFTMRWLIPRLSSFGRAHPGLEVRITTGLAPPSFEPGGYDLAIRGADAAPPGALSLPFMTELIVPVCHPDLLEGGRLATPAALAAQPLITYATEPFPWSAWLAAAGVPGLRPAAMPRFEQMFFALQAAQEGLGLALVPAFLVMDDIAAGRLAAPFGALGARRRRYFATAGARSPATLAFAAWLEREGRDTERMMEEWATRPAAPPCGAPPRPSGRAPRAGRPAPRPGSR